MAIRDTATEAFPAATLAPAVRTANTAVNGTGVDLQGYEAAYALVHFGAYTDGTHTPKLQESDDNSSFTDVAAADQVGSFTAAAAVGAANTTQKVAYRGNKRYIRIVMTTAGATSGAGSGAVIVRGRARRIGTAA